MAALTKTRTAIWTGTTLTAGAADTTSSWIDLSTALSAELGIFVTNGATGPTVGAQVQVQQAAHYNAGSPSQITNRGGALLAASANSVVTHFSMTIPMGVAAVRLVAGSNTGQAVTISADIGIVTGIA